MASKGDLFESAKYSQDYLSAAQWNAVIMCSVHSFTYVHENSSITYDQVTLSIDNKYH